MTPCQANEILDLWKSDAKHYPDSVINEALFTTGDLAASLDKAPVIHALREESSRVCAVRTELVR